MDINFQQLMAEAGEGFQPIPPGPYTVECEKAEAITSSTQKPQIRVTLRVLGGDHNGRKLFDQFTLTAGNPAALGFFFDNMASFGLDRSFFASNPAMPYVAQMLLGRQCNIAVGIEPYQGVDRNKVKQYRPIAGGQAPAMAPQQGIPGFPQGTMPMAPQPQPQFAPQPTQPYAPQGPPPGFPPQQPYAPQVPQPPMTPQPPQVPQVPQPQVPPVQEQPQYAPQTTQPAPWQQQPQQAPPTQYATQPAVDTQQYPAASPATATVCACCSWGTASSAAACADVAALWAAARVRRSQPTAVCSSATIGNAPAITAGAASDAPGCAADAWCPRSATEHLRWPHRSGTASRYLSA